MPSAAAAASAAASVSASAVSVGAVSEGGCARAEDPSGPQVDSSSNTVSIRMRPSMLPQLIPPTVFIEYPAELHVPNRCDTSERMVFPFHEYILSYKCYWERACIRTTFRMNGFKKKTKSWTVMWHKHATDEELRALTALQKVNHFSGSWCVGRKDRLARTMGLFKRLHGGDAYGFHPESYVLPNDRDALLRVAKADLEHNSTRSTTKKRPSSARRGAQAAYDSMLWIAKPVASSCGRGISVITTEQAVKLCARKQRKTLVQRYLARPYLIDGKKFDLRIYVLVSGVDPLRVYIYKEGLTRISTSKYSLSDIANKFAHLTNFSINKKNDIFKAADYPAAQVDAAELDGGRSRPSASPAVEDVDDPGDDGDGNGEDGGADIEIDEGEGEDEDAETEGFKWSLAAFRKWLAAREGEARTDEVFRNIYDVVVKTFVAAESEITPLLYKSANFRGSCFELFGCDIILDKYCTPHLLEVNVSPSLMGSSPLDLGIKGQLMSDVFHVVGLQVGDEDLAAKFSGPGGGDGVAAGSPRPRARGRPLHESRQVLQSSQFNPFAFCNLNKILSTQEDYRRSPSHESIDLQALSQVDREVVVAPFSASSADGAGNCAWWQMLIMVEDEMARARSTMFALAHPFIDRGDGAGAPRPPHDGAHYLTLYRNPRFCDHLLFKWLALGGAQGGAGKYLPPAVRQMMGQSAPRKPRAASSATPRLSSESVEQGQGGPQVLAGPAQGAGVGAVLRPRSASAAAQVRRSPATAPAAGPVGIADASPPAEPALLKATPPRAAPPRAGPRALPGAAPPLGTPAAPALRLLGGPLPGTNVDDYMLSLVSATSRSITEAQLAGNHVRFLQHLQAQRRARDLVSLSTRPL